MRALKIGGVIVGALIITALGIDAADTLNGSSGTLLAQLGGSGDTGGCPIGMIAIGAATTMTCVDMYEASTNADCPNENPANQLDTQANISTKNCAAESKKNTAPWRYITREEAQLVCVRAGKRLPNNAEWQLLAAGTPDTNSSCHTNGQLAKETGAQASCESAVGVFDAVGNVWEWTNEDVFDGQYNGRQLPTEGYVRQVDVAGIATVTGTSSSSLFGDDYFWSKESGAYTIMRGGYYGSRSDAGVYTTHAATLPTMTGAAIGFRCVK